MKSEALEQFKKKGYYGGNYRPMHSMLYNHPELRATVRVFRGITSNGGTGKTVSNRELFGLFNPAIYYQIDRKDEFVAYLAELFNKANPEPSPVMKGLFTRCLREHGLL